MFRHSVHGESATSNGLRATGSGVRFKPISAVLAIKYLLAQRAVNEGK